MKNLFTTAAALVLFAGAAAAQVTTQTAVLGESGNANYPVQIQGANGVVYNCKADLVTIDGQTARQCVSASGAGLGGLGAGLGGAGAAVGVGAAVIVAIAAASGGDSSSSTTTPVQN